MDSLEDNTTIIRMKKDFHSFIGRSCKKSRLSIEKSSLMSDADMSGASQASGVTMKSLIEREKEQSICRAELVSAKSYISQLEQQVSTLDSSRKRARIEHDRDVQNIKQECQVELQKLEELKTELQLQRHKEEDAKVQLNELRQSHDKMKTSYEQRLHQLQKDKIQLEVQLEEMELSLGGQITELKNDIMRQDTEKKICSLELEEIKEKLKTQHRRFAECSQQLQELEEYKIKALAADQKVQDLESTLSKAEEEIIITKAMKSKLDSFPELEKENRKLRDENQYLKDTQDNILLLREQAESSKIKLDRAEKKMADFCKLQTENEELKKKITKWEVEDSSGFLRPQSPTKLTRRLSDLQRSEVILSEKKGQLQASLHLLEERLRNSESKVLHSGEQYIAEKYKTDQQADFIKRLQRKLLLVTKERDGFKKIIDSYESEVTLNMGSVVNQSTTRVSQLEDTVEMYARHNAALDKNVAQLTEELTQRRTKIDMLQMKVKQLEHNSAHGSPASAQADQKTIIQLREKIVELEKRLETTEEEKYNLEVKMEQRHLQGDYDPTKTKVIHFSMNPSELAQNRRAEEVRKLREENERLQHRVRLLEENKGEVENLTMQVEEKLQEPCSSKEVEEMRAQLTKADLKNQRLMEAFKKTSQEYREVCYSLTGYKIDFLSNNQYRLMSMYAESPNDYLMFQQSGAGEMQVLETDFSSSLTEQVDMYLNQQDSIPAFLSSVTMLLFSRQTMQV